jgi:putative ABC transport system permease protein
MISPRWRKSLRDLYGNRLRTVLVVLPIAVSVLAIGTITNSQRILSRDLQESYVATNPYSVRFTTESFDREFVETVRSMRDVSTAEGRRTVFMRVKVGPEEWRPLSLVAIADYNSIEINKIWFEVGACPPKERELLIERSALGLTGAKVGDTVLVETPGGDHTYLDVAGLVHDPGRYPPIFTGNVYGYISMDTLERLGEPLTFNELSVIVAENDRDIEHIRRVADQIQDEFRENGLEARATVPTPGEHPISNIVQTLVLILDVLGVLSFLLSGFLVTNTVGALLARQVEQIGVMKAIGARTGQIIAMYLGTVLVYGVFALAVGVPLGVLGTYALTRYTANLLNLDITRFGVPLPILAFQVGIGLVVPLLAALYPTVLGSRITAREAISRYGLDSDRFGQGIIDSLLGRIHGLAPTLLLSFRNVFRRKKRLVLTLATLTLGSAAFIAVFSVRASLQLTLEDELNSLKNDLDVRLVRAYRVEKIVHEAQQVPGVAKVEAWGYTTGRRIRDDGSESTNVTVFAPPLATEMFFPTVLQGRWLVPKDEKALVINSNLMAEEPDIRVGDVVHFEIEGWETDWRIVGVVRGSLNAPPSVYVNYPSFARATRNVGLTTRIRIQTDRHDAAFQSRVKRDLEEQLEHAGMRIQVAYVTAEYRSTTERTFNIVTGFLLIMAVLLVLVGGLGLAGMMSINVLERTCEVGVMRAIGASNGIVLWVFIVEGVSVGLLSWLLGIVLALPLSQFLSNAVGIVLLKIPPIYAFSVNGALIWLFVAVFLATLASLLPAWNASRISVRDVLAYA